jgi:hypothetical protein
MSVLSADIVVREKVSFVWCLASLSVSVSAVLIGGLVALRSSVKIAPSRMRRWTEEGIRVTGTGEFESLIPVRLHQRELVPLFNHVKNGISSDHVTKEARRKQAVSTRRPSSSDTVSAENARRELFR